MNPLYTENNIPQGADPTITSFTANPQTVSPGSPVTLSWSVSNAEYNIVSPQVGVMRGNSAGRDAAEDDDLHALFDQPIREDTAKVKVTVK